MIFISEESFNSRNGNDTLYRKTFAVDINAIVYKGEVCEYGHKLIKLKNKRYKVRCKKTFRKKTNGREYVVEIGYDGFNNMRSGIWINPFYVDRNKDGEICGYSCVNLSENKNDIFAGYTYYFYKEFLSIMLKEHNTGANNEEELMFCLYNNERLQIATLKDIQLKNGRKAVICICKYCFFLCIQDDNEKMCHMIAISKDDEHTEEQRKVISQFNNMSIEALKLFKTLNMDKFKCTNDILKLPI